MKAKMRTTLLITTAALVVGVILTVGGFKINVQRIDLKQEVTVEDNLPPFTAVRIDGDMANVSISVSEQATLEITNYSSELYNVELGYEVINGTLFIRPMGDTNRRPTDTSLLNYGITHKTNEIKLQIPADRNLSDIDVTLVQGDISIAEVLADTLTVDTAYGALNLEDCSIDRNTLSMNTVNALVSKVSADSFEIDSQYGEITFSGAPNNTLSNFSVNADTATIQISDLDTESLSLTNSYKLVELQNLTAKRSRLDLSNCKVTGSSLNIGEVLSTLSYGSLTVDNWQSTGFQNGMEFCDVKISGVFAGTTDIQATYGSLNLSLNANAAIDITSKHKTIKVNGENKGYEYSNASSIGANHLTVTAESCPVEITL